MLSAMSLLLQTGLHTRLLHSGRHIHRPRQLEGLFYFAFEPKQCGRTELSSILLSTATSQAWHST